MRLLLIDNSNTRTKFALASGEHLDPGIIRIPTAALDRTAIEELRERLEFDASVLCSVVPAKSRVLRAALAGKPLHVVGCHSTLPIGINYPAPEQIGADRLANAVAAYQQWGAPAVVIDFGTAVTFDVVGLDGGQPSYLGGVITPGLASMTATPVNCCQHVKVGTLFRPPVSNRRKVGTTSSQYGPYAWGCTRTTMPSTMRTETARWRKSVKLGSVRIGGCNSPP